MSGITTIAGSDSQNSTRAVINTNFANQANCHKGPSAPSTGLAAGFLWLDDDTPSATVWTMKQYDGTDWITLYQIDTTANVIIPPTSLTYPAFTMGGDIAMGGNQVTGSGNASASGELPNKGQVDGRVHIMAVPLGTQSATFDRFLMIGTGSIVITNIYVLVGTTVASSGTDYWTFQVRNLTAAVNLFATAFTTNGTAITADALTSLGTVQNGTPAASDVLQFQAATTLSPTALDAEACVLIRYTVTT